MQDLFGNEIEEEKKEAPTKPCAKVDTPKETFTGTPRPYYVVRESKLTTWIRHYEN